MEPLTSNVTDTALIFEGGGMRASYTSAVVVALLEAGIHFDWVGGISAGSTNLANYLSRHGERARGAFVEFVHDPKMGNWRTWLRGEGLFNARYIYQESAGPEAVMPFKFDTFTANPASCRIGAYRLSDAEGVYWGREDVATLEDLMTKVQASSTMPGLMPFVTIDGEVYCDGALGPSGGIALDAAQADGHEKFFVVLTRERAYLKPPSRLPAATKALFRRYPAVAEGLLQRAANYNRVREELFELERQGKAYVFVPEKMSVSNGERNYAKLKAAHDMGLAQSERELPVWREFLGLEASYPQV